MRSGSAPAAASVTTDPTVARLAVGPVTVECRLARPTDGPTTFGLNVRVHR